jgi:long-subunit fatty acid transport protein
MRMRTPLLAGALCLAYATPAFACNFYFNSTFMRIPARPSFGAGVEANLADPATFAISGDVAMRLGNNMVVQPAIGVCVGDDDTDPFFGAGVAYKLTQSGTMGLNLQSGISYMPQDGANFMSIPIGLAASFAGSGSMGFYAGASLVWTQVDFESDLIEDFSDSDPVLFGGLQNRSGSMGWSLGAQLLLGDDTEFGIVAGISMNQGASAIRHIGKLIKR